MDAVWWEKIWSLFWPHAWLRARIPGGFWFSKLKKVLGKNSLSPAVGPADSCMKFARSSCGELGKSILLHDLLRNESLLAPKKSFEISERPIR